MEILLLHFILLDYSVVQFIEVPANYMMVETSSVQVTISESNISYTIFMPCQLLKHSSFGYLPDYDCLVISTRVEPIFVDSKSVHPSLMPRELNHVACFNVKRPDRVFAPGYKNEILENAEAFNSFLSSDKCFNNFILLDVEAPYHVVPASCIEHLHLD